jgi:GrpB protein
LKRTLKRAISEYAPLAQPAPDFGAKFGVMSNIALRDFLRNDPVARERYREAKLAAVAAGANTLLAYSKLKGPVIQALLIQALPKGTI